MASTRGRQVVVPLTNKSGGSVAAGDVVVVDTANDTAFTTTTTGRAEVSVGIAQETIANTASGRVLVAGYAALVNVPASVTRGHYVETHTVAKQATGSSTRRSGSLGQFLTGGTTPTAVLWGQTDQAASGGNSFNDGEGDPAAVALTAADGTSSYAARRDHVHTPRAFIGARVYNSANISIGNNSVTALTFNSERYDSDAYHDTGSNTGRLTVPSGKSGKHRIAATVIFAANATGVRAVHLRVNGTTFIAQQASLSLGGSIEAALTVMTDYDLSATDYVEVTVYQNSGGNLNVQASGNQSPEFMIEYLGA